jgi:hypothetical protein
MYAVGPDALAYRNHAGYSEIPIDEVDGFSRTAILDGL